MCGASGESSSLRRQQSQRPNHTYTPLTGPTNTWSPLQQKPGRCVPLRICMQQCWVSGLSNKVILPAMGDCWLCSFKWAEVILPSASLTNTTDCEGWLCTTDCSGGLNHQTWVLRWAELLILPQPDLPPRLSCLPPACGLTRRLAQMCHMCLTRCRDGIVASETGLLKQKLVVGTKACYKFGSTH